MIIVPSAPAADRAPHEQAGGNRADDADLCAKKREEALEVEEIFPVPVRVRCRVADGLEAVCSVPQNVWREDRYAGERCDQSCATEDERAAGGCRQIGYRYAEYEVEHRVFREQAQTDGDAEESGGRCEVRADLQRPLAGRTALVLDDVIDTGLSLSEAARLVRGAGASEVLTAVFARKPWPRARAIEPDFVAWEAPARFLVGYGMDRGGALRGLPYVAAAE